MPADALGVSRRGSGRRLVLVHGFTQTARSWDPLTSRLAERFEVVAVDAPGHGSSADVVADLPGGGAMLADVAGRGTYVGYSMGGRLCLHTALARPDVVERLVLVSATGGIDDAEDRAARRAADDALADSIERDGVDPFLEWWVAQPMFATLPDAGLADRRTNTAAGLASSLRLAGTGTQVPLWDRMASIDVPVLLVAGALDAKFVAAAERMATLLPLATVAVVADAGHTVHLEQPTPFLDVLVHWLATS
ncbi:MAG: alpha/beta fold hydrolase [Ilumatobacteraceae bacterium]